MSALGDWAAKVADAAARIESDLATDVARAQGDKFIEIERLVTPKRSGALAASEHIDAVTGGGTHATAVGGPHKRYAVFRNDGGEINAKMRWIYHGNRRYRHTLFFDGTFALHVSQTGAHYVQKAEGAAAGPLAEVAEQVLAFFLDF